MDKINIDSFINTLGYEINKNCNNEQRRFIDKALGVLVNDGVYAYYVFCKAKSENKDKAKETKKTKEDIFVNDIVNEIKKVESLKEYFIYEKQENDSKTEDENELFFRNLSSDLHKLLFFRDILERALIYARYHAKALTGGSNE